MQVFALGIVSLLLWVIATLLQVAVTNQRIVYKDPITHECIGVKKGRNITDEGCRMVTPNDKVVVLGKKMTLQELQKTFK